MSVLMRYHHNFHLLCLLLLLFSTSLIVTPTLGSSMSSSSEKEKETDGNDEIQFVNLSDLNNTELENICIMRGFELKPKTHPDTGQILKFSHDDYMEAAQQCLDVQAEMEKMIQHNPNIRQELEEERIRLEVFKETLEDEIKAKQADLKAKEEEQIQNCLNNVAAFHRESNETCSTSSTASSSSSDDATSSSKKKKPYDNSRKIQLLPDDSLNEKISSSSAAAYNPLSYKAIFQESILELRSKLSSDIQIVSNIIFPSWFREPLLQQIVFPLGRVTKRTSSNVIAMVKKYMFVFLEDLKKKKQQQQKEQTDKTSI